MTTIQLSDDTKADLEDLKQVEGEPFESVVQRLIASYSESQSGELSEEEVREIVNEQINERVIPEAQR